MSYTTAWIMWGVMFLVIEGGAIVDKRPHDTLSEHIWRWIGIRGYKKPNGWKARRAGLGIFLLWLVGHLLGGL